MKKKDIDYALYLVTDSTPAILGDRDLSQVVEGALRGGVTCVQYRDKTSDTGVLISVAKKLHEITRRYNVPLIINDRVDVALAVGCEGVHIGQDDMDLSAARKLLGPDAVIGVSASTVEEALQASRDGADYLGVGTVYSTSTKKDTKNIIGTKGVRDILKALASAGHSTKVVIIGGLTAANVQNTVFNAGCPGCSPAGVAVVSAVVAAADPEHEARKLLGLVKALPPFRLDADNRVRKVADARELVAMIPGIVTLIDMTTPLSHNMTNLVVQNFAANVALAIGASPIMSNSGEEAADLAKLGGALVVNMGTVTPQGLESYAQAIKAYNAAGQAVVFDPVGAGATAVRRAAVKTILAAGRVDIIKGNEGEILAVDGAAAPQQRGVDSASTLPPAAKAALARRLAARTGAVVVVTGATDYASDGARAFAVANGHPLLARTTGAGCVLGTVMSAAAAVQVDDRLLAAVAALVLFEVAAEAAAAREDVRGPGTFAPALLDELDRLRRLTVEGDLRWLSAARVTAVEAEEP